VKLHNTAIQNLIRIFTTYGGFRSEHRLVTELSKVDFDVYTQKTGKQVIVLKDDVAKAQKQ
jgi:hypothetical protein